MRGVTQFIIIFSAAVYTYYYEDVDPDLKPINVPQSEVLPEYDFVVIGAGSAGSVVANRLSENPSWNILLLEAGGRENEFTDCPALMYYSWTTEANWNYSTVPQKRACRAILGLCDYPRGRALGGSSTINGMMYVRGNAEDYNSWAAMGNEGWSYADVLPYFVKSENASEIRPYRDAPYRGTQGPLHVQYPRYHSPFIQDFINAAKEIGFVQRDYNDGTQNGVDLTQYTLKGPSRCSVAKSYLDPVRHRNNLFVAERAFVTKLLIDSSTKTVTGVEYVRNCSRYTVSASKEVILSAGAINTPQILLLSGIGPSDHLSSLNITVIENLPVGNNLQDHLMTAVTFAVNVSLDLYNNTFSERSILDYAVRREGPLTSLMLLEAISFENVFNPGSPPNVQYTYGVPTNYGPTIETLITIHGANIFPTSRGTVRLKSTNPMDAPLIDPNYLATEEDVVVSVESINRIFNYINTSVMQKYSPSLALDIQPQCASALNNRTELARCLLYEYSATNFHPVGTAKMGPSADPDAVVGPTLKVHGISNLRVVDNSIMPRAVRGNTNAPSIMIGEVGADLIRKEFRT